MDDKEKLLESLGVPLLSTLEENGLTKAELVRLLKEELSATSRKSFSFNGSIIYSEPEPLWEIRQRARQDILKLLALYPKGTEFEQEIKINLINYHQLTNEQIETRIASLATEAGYSKPTETVKIGYEETLPDVTVKPEDQKEVKESVRTFNPQVGYPRSVSAEELKKVRKLD